MVDMKGSELFVKALKEEGVDLLFGYPGGYAVDLFDALYEEEEIEVVMPRREQGLVHAADGYARTTGKVGVCLVTSGPGATNLVTGIATANYDSVPLVCITGQVVTNLIGNDAFQEVDIVGITRSICKYAVTVRNRKDLGRILKEAFYIARTGKPGPVLVDFPRDLQKEYGCGEYPNKVQIRGYKPYTGAHTGQLKKAMAALLGAKKPVFLAGGGVTISHAQEEMKRLSEITGIPVITTIMGKGAIPSEHPLYIGNLGMHGSYAANQAVSQCDVLFSIGTRFNDRITGRTEDFAKNAVIIHVDIEPASISRNIAVDVPIVADAKEAISGLLADAKPLDTKEWREEISGWDREHPILRGESLELTPEKIIRNINENFSHSIVVTDVGQNQLWTTQYLDLDENRQLVTSGGLGTMGYGLPAAIGAKLGNPNREVICISGDGGIQMNIQELATASLLGLPVIICILNNSYLGNVRQWQEMFFDKRYASTCLRARRNCLSLCNDPKECDKSYIPDFIKLAESYQVKGIRVTKEEEIANALHTAKRNQKGPTLIEFVIEREANVLPIVPGGNSLTEMILDF